VAVKYSAARKFFRKRQQRDAAHFQRLQIDVVSSVEGVATTFSPSGAA